MTTAQFTSVKSETSIKKCLEYSDNPEQLKELLESLEVEVKFTGIRKYFSDDEKERLTGVFKITRNNKSIEFDFGFSMYDTAYALIPDNTQNSRPLFNIVSFLDNYENRKKVYSLIKEDWVNKSPKSIWEAKRDFKEGLLYNCLASCNSDYFIPIDFDDFCSEFGYGNDSITAKKTWESCLKQSSKLQKIFTEDEIQCLPS